MINKNQILLLFGIMCATLPYYGYANSKQGDFVNVLDYGVIPNDQLNDAPAFQAAIDVAAVSGRTLYIPKGNYHLDTTVVINTPITILGDGFNTTIRPRNCGAFAIEAAQVKIENLFILGEKESTNTEDYFGIRVSNGNTIRNITIRDVRIDGVATGIYLHKAWYATVDNLTMEHNALANVVPYTGIHLQGNSVNTRLINNQINVAGDAINIERAEDGSQPEGIMITNNLLVGRRFGVWIKRSLSIHISNNVIDLCGEQGIRIDTANGVLINNNWISNRDAADNIFEAINIKHSIACMISNNNIQNRSGLRGISIKNGSNGNVITNNTFTQRYAQGAYFIGFDTNTQKNIVSDNILRWFECFSAPISPDWFLEGTESVKYSASPNLLEENEDIVVVCPPEGGGGSLEGWPIEQ
ncbi:MAG TPA: hypothetical protein DCE41_10050 [Cytophagales bacterium]|nr:hypothetical protein [Cytophagales bacterium]HAA22084.1 hypothetical protein [Cytophagales bacterium]